MTKEDEELLLKDICSRIPYGVIGKFKNSDQQIYGIFHDLLEGWQVSGITLTESISTIKPYLFPLSSMTMEQAQQWHKYANDRGGLAPSTDWLNAHHFDYRGLIPMGLAKDATGLNIY